MTSSPSTASPRLPEAGARGLFDQSALSQLAQRLVEAAKRAGADAADAVAVRGVSQGVEVRDGVLNLGLPAVRLYLAVCDPFAGKTTLALQFLVEAIAAG